MILAGSTGYATCADSFEPGKTVDNFDKFFYILAICFPAFTGMTYGLGLSGDLKDSKKYFF